MATRRKASSTRRRRATTNPRRRRRNPARAAVTRYASNRRSNRRVRRNRRRNPQIKTLLIGGLYAGAGAWAYGMVKSFIPLRAEGIAGIGINLGIAYLTAMIGERFLGGGAQAFTYGAAGAVGLDILNYVLGVVRGPITGALAPASAPQIGGGEQPALPAAPPGMSDIVAAPDWYQGMGDVVSGPDYYS